MRVAALYDIHGNLPALGAALQEVRVADVDRLVFGGDCVPGPIPRETLDVVLSLEIPSDFVLGNGDREVLAIRKGEKTGGIPPGVIHLAEHSARHLRPEHAAAMEAWPATVTMDLPGLGRVLFCHAVPRNDTDIFTRLTPDEKLAPYFEGIDADLVVCGHTHMQFDRRVGSIRVVNAGSVGMPYGEPGAYWLLLGETVEFRRTLFDVEDAASRILASDYPDRVEFAASNVLNVPSEHEALRVFSPNEAGG